MLEAALFDLDGTLFNTQNVNFYAYKEAMDKFGYELDYEYFCKHCNGKFYLDFLPSISTDDIEILERIHEKKKNVYSKYLDKAIPNDVLFSLIDMLSKRCKLGIVTTASRKNAEEILKKYNKKDYFDIIICREDYEKSKPHPEAYLVAMEKLGVKCENTIIFEDSDAGIKAAESSNASVVVVKGYN